MRINDQYKICGLSVLNYLINNPTIRKEMKERISKDKLNFMRSWEERVKEEEEIIDYEDNFNTEQLARIVKIAGLGNNIQLFVGENLPMLFRTNVGGLGKISIYVKSKSLISADNRPPGITM